MIKSIIKVPFIMEVGGVKERIRSCDWEAEMFIPKEIKNCNKEPEVDETYLFLLQRTCDKGPF